MTRERYVILGAGGIGAGIGGLLHRAGREVVLVARGAHLDALRRRGLRLRTPRWTEVLAVSTAAAPEQVRWRPGDVVVLATKLNDAPAALDALRRATGERLTVVTAQNGLAGEIMAARRGFDVVAAMVWVAASFLVPGEVSLHDHPGVGIIDGGGWPSGGGGRAPAVAAALAEAGFDAEVRPALMAFKRAKLLTNLAGVLAAVCTEAPAPLVDGLADEARAAYAAAGLPWVPLARLLERVSGDRLRTIDGERREGGSAWQTLVRRRPSEVDFLCGEIVALGATHGVPTPLNRALQRATHRLCAEGGAPRSVSPQALLLAARSGQSG